MKIGESESSFMNLRAPQEGTRAQCFHPAGAVAGFALEDVETSIPKRFESIVSMFPERLAVKSQEKSFTYDELNTAANRIAHAISEYSESIEEPIALMLEPGSDIVAAILGVVKAGKVYVPLDPGFPLLRNQEILQDSTACRLVTNNRNLSLANELAGDEIVVINIDDLPLSLEFAKPLPWLNADTLANILYTSGSTGKPKGVVQNHRNILHLIMRYTNRALITPEDRIALLRSFNVHQGTLMTLAALLNGAAILPFDTKREGLRELAHWLGREDVTIARMGPTLLRHLTDVLGGEDSYPKLRELSFSGEPLYWRDVERVRKHIPSNCVLVNCFGSTEVSSCCEYILPTDPTTESGVVPCGYSTKGMEILLLQDDGREAATRDIGEIAVRSRYLALAYWRNPELTETKFLPSANGKEDRIYRTGDQGRLLPDGRLEHLGRKDFQVKIRGYRVELSEIESALLALDDIKDAVVVGQEVPAGEKCLVAYVVPQLQPAPTMTSLRRALHDRLPDYMTPAAFVVLDALPLTPNGKVDRRALPVPTDARPDLDTAYVAPRNSTERELAAIWSEVLGVEGIGIYDDFLDLGGHSLAATRVVSRIYAACQIELPLERFVKTSTIAALADYLQKAQPSSVKYEPICPAPKDGPLPISFSQQRLWFLNQLAPDNPVYNEPKTLRFTGGLNVEALQKAISEIVARHEILRSTFSSRDGKATMVVGASRPVEMPLVDLSQKPAAQREKELRQRLKEFTQQPFNLNQDLLLRATLFRMDEEDHVLLLVVHHIATDGWSSTILFRELSWLYSGFATDRPAPLANLDIQYADFAAWQRKWLQGDVLEAQLLYWRKQLQDAPVLLDLPTDRPRPAVQNFHGATLSVELPRELTRHLKALSRDADATLFMTLLAAFHILLQRYTKQDDLLVATPVANRKRVELENLIGCFVNTLVLRLNMSDEPSFRDLLARTREACIGAYCHQDLPFERLVEELEVDRGLYANPFAQVMFQLRNVPERAVSLPGVASEEVEFDRGIAKFDLTLTLVERGDHMVATMEYNTDLFDAATIERMLGHYQTLLQGIVTNPEQRVFELPVLTQRERHQLLVEWNDTKTDYSKNKCIHQLFEEQVERTADAIAVVFEDQQLTYRELNSKANQLAHYLRKLGVGPEVLVGLCLERSIDMIVGLLGILKAGGAYVPLDPSYPQERLQFILEDTLIGIVLTTTVFSDRLTPCGPRPTCLDRDWQVLRNESKDNLVNQSIAGNLAYIIYTSGSTGNPKGVEVPHRGVLRLVLGTDYANFDTRQTFLQMAPLSFDAATFEVWGPLLNGAKCILYPNSVPTAKDLGEVLKTNQVSTVWLTSALFNSVIDQEPTVLSDVTQLLIGGEALSVPHVRKGVELLPNIQIINGYGPTECTTFTCCYPIPREIDEHLTSIPIGKPIANAQMFILDGHLNPVAIGVVGEIHIGGYGLARGYLNRPELTEEKFIANPFSSAPGARLYKTGDLARYLPDGNIEFLGRIDNQVKIRGFRIEPGEIETVLAKHPVIQQTVVIAREDTPGDKRLVAYVVTGEGATPSVNDLRTYLQQKLPDYMVPSAFVFLDSLPLTPNGKLDRKALPALDHIRPEQEGVFAAPRTPVEEILADIWHEVLKLDKVGVNDNFFHLGGHSLLATRVVSRVNHSFQSEVSLRTLFETPTIAGLADSVQASLGIATNLHRVHPIVPVPRGNDTPLSFAQERLWFLDRLDPDSPTYNIPAAFRLTGELNLDALEQSLNEIVRRHESLRTVFATLDGNPVQQILPSLAISLTPIDLTTQLKNQREGLLQSLLKDEALQSFDLKCGPLIRARLWRVSPLEHVFALNLHHIISDGWSMGVLFREVSALYKAYCTGESASLPNLPIQYADYSVWQRDWLQGGNLQRQLSYWRKQLDSLSTLQLPTDHPRPPVQTYRGSSVNLEFPSSLSQALKGLSRREGVTLFMTLLAAFQTLLCRYSGQDDIAVGTPIAGRTRQETEELIGFFVNTLVLRTDLSNNPTFKDLLGQVRETTLDAFTHQDLPFEKLVEELKPERNLSQSPLFQVFFNMLEVEDDNFKLKRLEVKRLSTGDAGAKFDLTMYVREKDGKIGLSLVYNADLFEADTISSMLNHYHKLLEGIVENPNRQISRYSLLTAESHRRVSDRSNSNGPVNPFVEFKRQDIEQSICARFEQQTRLFPTKLAVTTQEHQWSYAELNRQANRIAHTFLQYCGHGGERIGLLFNHGAPMVAAILGALKSNNAYVPLDPFHPHERLAYISGNCRTAVIVCDRNNLAQALTLGRGSVPVIDVDEIDGATSTDNPALVVSPDALAYILYTSGSTGQPKGVMQNHRNVLHHIRCYTNNLHIAAADKLTLLSSYGFDAAVMDIFGALLNGATLCPMDVKVGDAAAIVERISSEAVTIYHSTPTVYRYLFAGLNGQRQVSTIRLIVLGGEEVQKADVDLFKKYCSDDCVLVNGLGPTESSLALQNFISHKTQISGPRVPVGYPVGDTEVLLLNEAGTNAEIYGEIAIRSEHVALGYWQRPELTTAAFMTDPRGGGRRLYRTGDMGRLLPDGSISFCGRRDFQVKIRGFRIELGEIEAALGQHPGVRESVVIVTQESTGDKRLVAYVVNTAEFTVSAPDLRRYLQHKLPEYMAPSVLVFLDSLPLTPNGKLDRKALPAPDQSRPDLEDAFPAPRTPVEEILANIWAEVLKLDKVGIHDNFFHLGGHSLLATQVVSRIRDSLKVDLLLRALFEAPTIEGLAQKLQELGDKQELPQTVGIAPIAREQYRVQRTNGKD